VNVITGGGGLLGSHLAAELIARGESVRIVDNFAAGQMENIADIRGRVDIKWGDICQLDFLLDAFKEADTVYHLAAQTDPAQAWLRPDETANINIGGTLAVLRACSFNKVNKLVFGSCGSVYGHGESEPRSEETPVRPSTPLAISKLAAERYCLSWGEQHGLDVTCLRFFELYGPCAVPPKCSRPILTNVPVVYPLTRDFLHVSDAVTACLTIRENGVVNVGTGVGTTYEEVASILDSLSESPAERSTGDLTGEPEHNVADTTLAESLGFTAKIDLKEGLSCFALKPA
jgi:UDP-glucose 4-epimerase